MTHLRVQELAEAQGFNITTLARKAEVSYTTLHPIWHNRVQQVHLRTMDRLAIALEVNVSDLFGGEPQAGDYPVPGAS